MTFARISFVLLGLAVAASSASAVGVSQGPRIEICGQQIRIPQDNSAWSTIEEVSERAARQENGGVEGSPAQTEVSLVASKDTTSAKFTLSVPREQVSGKGRFVATVTTPVKKADPTTEVLTRGGLVEDVEVSLGWKRQWFERNSLVSLGFLGRGERQQALCKHFAVPQDLPCSDTEFAKALEAKGVEDPSCFKRAFTEIRDDGGQQQSLLRAAPLRYFEVAGTVGRTEREYFTTEAVKREDDRLSSSFSVTYGRIFDSSRLTGSVGIVRKYKEGTEIQVCEPAKDAPDLEACATHPLNEAAELDEIPVTFEYRFWAKWVAASPSATYDFEGDSLAASLPLYLVRDDDDLFTGGVRVDWKEGAGPVFSVFVAAPLGL